MVPSIARQSIVLKCNMQKSVMLGNYEFYYAAGLLAKLTGIAVPEDIAPEALQELLHTELATHTFTGEQEAYLWKITSEYRPDALYDGQMQELLAWGKNETALWQVNI